MFNLRELYLSYSYRFLQYVSGIVRIIFTYFYISNKKSEKKPTDDYRTSITSSINIYMFFWLRYCFYQELLSLYRSQTKRW